MAQKMAVEITWQNGSETLLDIYTALPSNNTYTSYPDMENIIAALLYLVIAVVGIVGNAMVLLAVTMSRRLQTSANAFVAALSVSDFITSITLPIQSAALLGMWSRVFFFFCSIAATSFYIFIGSNVHLLAAIAFNRYIHITKHTHSYRKQFQKRRVTLVIILSYAIPLSLTGLGHAFGGAQSGICPSHKTSVNTCTVQGQTFDFVIASVIVFLVTVTLVFYILIYVHVRHHFKAVAVKISCEDDISVIYRGNISASGKRSSILQSSSGVSDGHGNGGNQELPQGISRTTLHPSSAKVNRPRRIPTQVVLENANDTPGTSMGNPLDAPSTSSYNPAVHNRHREPGQNESQQRNHAWPQHDKRSQEPMARFQSLSDGSSHESHDDTAHHVHRQSPGVESPEIEVCFRARSTSTAPSTPPPPTNSTNMVIIRRPATTETPKRRLFRFGKNDMESKITINMFLVVVAFLACLSPTIIFLVIVHTITNSTAGCTISEAYVLVILSANCCINPIIYGWRHPLFRRVFVCILHGKFHEIERPSAWLRRLLR